MVQMFGRSNQIKSNVAFWRLGKTEVPGGKPMGSEKGTNIISPHMMPSLGMMLSLPHWWKASAVTIASTLLR